MNETRDTQPKEDFDTRLKRAQGKDEGWQKTENTASNSDGKGLAFKIGTELVVAVIVGGVIGYFLDSWLGTKPWLLILFMLLGNAAGLWNIFRLTNNQGYSLGFMENDRNSKNGNE